MEGGLVSDVKVVQYPQAAGLYQRYQNRCPMEAAAVRVMLVVMC